MKENILVFLLMLVCFIIGLLFGRHATNTTEKTEYIKGELISGSVSPGQLIPVKEETHDNPTLPVKTILKDRIIIQMVDTVAIIAEYIQERTYNTLLFDDKKLGRLELYPTVRYNKISAIDYDFTPVIQQKTIYKTAIWQPFVSGSYSTLNYAGIGGGIFYHHLGFEYQYLISLGNQSNGHLIGIKYKF